MTKRLWLILTGILLGGILVAITYAETEKTEPADQATLQAKIERLIKNLGADDWKTREEATEELKKIGRPAIPALKKALESDDPEVTWRSRLIIRAIDRAEKESAPEDDTVKIWPKVQKFPGKLKIIIQGNEPYQAFTLHRDPSGKITVTVKKKTKEGKEETKTYSADSIEEFQKNYPEIAEQFGIKEMELREIPEIDPDEIWEELGKTWGKRWDEMRKEMKRMEEWLKKGFERDFLDELLPRPPKIRPMPTPASRNKLGMTVEFVDEILREHLNLPEETGILVKDVLEDSLAEKIGFQKGDVILKVNDQPIKTIWEFKHLMDEALEKDKVNISIIRKGNKQELKYRK